MISIIANRTGSTLPICVRGTSMYVNALHPQSNYGMELTLVVTVTILYLTHPKTKQSPSPRIKMKVITRI